MSASQELALFFYDGCTYVHFDDLASYLRIANTIFLHDALLNLKPRVTTLRWTHDNRAHLALLYDDRLKSWTEAYRSCLLSIDRDGAALGLVALSKPVVFTDRRRPPPRLPSFQSFQSLLV